MNFLINAVGTRKSSIYVEGPLAVDISIDTKYKAKIMHWLQHIVSFLKTHITKPSEFRLSMHREAGKPLFCLTFITRSSSFCLLVINYALRAEGL